MHAAIVSPNPAEPRDTLAHPTFHNLDLLRFVAAMIVVLYHVTAFFPDYVMSGGVYANTRYLAHTIAVLLFNGPAAVMVFFMVSGICIHAPYRGDRPIHVREFYVRRLIRIGVPLMAAWVYSSAVTAVCGASALPVWSLWCEIAYYLLYPVLVIVIGRCGFRATLIMSVGAAFLLCSIRGDALGGPWSFGPFFTWIIFLPVWLTGVWICENSRRPILGFSTLSSLGFVGLGGLILFGVPAVMMMLVKLDLVKRPLYLIFLFSALAAPFIALAIKVDLSRHAIIRFMERKGRWSYSLYLVHFPLLYLGTWLLVRNGFMRMGPAGLMASACAVVVASILLSIVFYHLVEKPSHLLAKGLAIRVRERYPQLAVVAGVAAK
jgi:peptidoglycan/LPS O-acetylase OafA/YrhL